MSLPKLSSIIVVRRTTEKVRAVSNSAGKGSIEGVLNGLFSTLRKSSNSGQHCWMHKLRTLVFDNVMLNGKPQRVRLTCDQHGSTYELKVDDDTIAYANKVYGVNATVVFFVYADGQVAIAITNGLMARDRDYVRFLICSNNAAPSIQGLFPQLQQNGETRAGNFREALNAA